VGYLPAADRQTEGDRVLLVATYSGPPPLNGVTYPGADDNASGVALMLEIGRLLRDLDFEPKRTVVFAAVDKGGDRFLGNYPVLPTGPGDSWTAIIVDGVGAGNDRLAHREAGSGLTQAFDESARRFRVRTEPLDNWWFFFVPLRRRSWTEGGYFDPIPGYSGLAITRLGDELSGTPDDRMDHLDAVKLVEAGQVISHFLMVVSSR
jgi:hypothetical protein